MRSDCISNVFKTSLRGSASRFLSDAKGNATMLFGIASVPMLLSAGIALDLGRINYEQTSFYAAVDSATLAIAADDRSATQGLSETQIAEREVVLEGIAQDYINKHYAANSTLLAEVTGVDVKVTGQEVRLRANAKIDTLLMDRIPDMLGLMSTDHVNLDFESTVKKAMRPIELVMVMDTTGSMASSGKLSGAKSAAKTLMNTLYGGSLSAVNSSQFIRTSLVPFSGAVRLNQTAYDFSLGWIDTTGANPISKINFSNSTTTPPTTWNNYTAWSNIKRTSSAYHSWNGCVEVRNNAGGIDHRTSDTAPTGGDSLFPAYFNPDTAQYRASSSSSYSGTGIDYITGTSLTSVGSECRGLTNTSSSCSSSAAGTTSHRSRQENYLKYVDRVVGAESTSTNGPWTNCTGSSIVPMTHDRAKVENGIDAMVATGPTVIPEGLAWGWRAISPTEPFSKVEGFGSIPNATLSPYNDVRWQKIMVLMTDGDNDVGPGSYSINGTHYTSYGHSGESGSTNRFGTTSSSAIEGALDTNMTTICSNIKANGVKLYVASFGSGISTATRNLLQGCSSGAGYYQHASTSADLTAFFNHIGEDVLNKSIYVAK